MTADPFLTSSAFIIHNNPEITLRLHSIHTLTLFEGVLITHIVSITLNLKKNLTESRFVSQVEKQSSMTSE